MNTSSLELPNVLIHLSSWFFSFRVDSVGRIPPVSRDWTIIFWLNSVRSQISPAVLFYGLFVLKLIQSRWETGKWLWYVIEILISRFHAEEIKSQWDTLRVLSLLLYTEESHRYTVGYKPGKPHKIWIITVWIYSCAYVFYTGPRDNKCDS